MPGWTVKRHEVDSCTRRYHVEAETADTALQLVEDGEVEYEGEDEFEIGTETEVLSVELSDG